MIDSWRALYNAGYPDACKLVWELHERLTAIEAPKAAPDVVAPRVRCIGMSAWFEGKHYTGVQDAEIDELRRKAACVDEYERQRQTANVDQAEAERERDEALAELAELRRTRNAEKERAEANADANQAAADTLERLRGGEEVDGVYLVGGVPPTITLLKTLTAERDQYKQDHDALAAKVQEQQRELVAGSDVILRMTDEKADLERRLARYTEGVTTEITYVDTQELAELRRKADERDKWGRSDHDLLPRKELAELRRDADTLERLKAGQAVEIAGGVYWLTAEHTEYCRLRADRDALAAKAAELLVEKADLEESLRTHNTWEALMKTRVAVPSDVYADLRRDAERWRFVELYGECSLHGDNEETVVWVIALPNTEGGFDKDVDAAIAARKAAEPNQSPKCTRCGFLAADSGPSWHCVQCDRYWPKEEPTL